MEFNKTQTRKLLSFKRYLEKFCDGKTLTCLSHQTIVAMTDCYNEIVSTGKAVTFQKDVADRFANKGFRVEPDRNPYGIILHHFPPGRKYFPNVCSTVIYIFVRFSIYKANWEEKFYEVNFGNYVKINIENNWPI